MRQLLRNLIVVLLFACAGHADAQSHDHSPGTGDVPGLSGTPGVPSTIDETNADPAVVRDPSSVEAPGSGPHVRIRLHPVRISLKDFLDRVSIADVLDLLSRL